MPKLHKEITKKTWSFLQSSKKQKQQYCDQQQNKRKKLKIKTKNAPGHKQDYWQD